MPPAPKQTARKPPKTWADLLAGWKARLDRAEAAEAADRSKETLCPR